MTYPPMLMDPILLTALAVLVFWWLYCIEHADRRLHLKDVPQGYVNLAVLLGGPVVWVVLLVVTRREAGFEGPRQWLATQLQRLGLRGGGVRPVGGGESSVVLCSSDGQPVGRGLRGPLRDTRALMLAHQMVDYAIDLRASDILLEPKADQTYQLRYRVDGLLRNPEEVDADLAVAAINCFKIVGDMDIAERRRAQDGALLARRNEHEIKLRAATAGTLYGEKIAIRVLDSAAALLKLDQLGMRDDHLKRIRQFLLRPHGMLLVCGPTGSGKTTTLYAALGALEGTGRNIVTIEDPIEYPLPLASQTEINVKAGITFAGQLRHVLRQSPDVIMVGEIRDAETARIALQASETGHLVLSTLHANDALTGLVRLIDLGIEPYLVGAGLAYLLSQRLVRRLCLHCRCRPAISQRLSREATRRKIALKNVFQQNGCLDCGHTGYHGRTCVVEMLEVTPDLAELLTSRPSLSALAAAARQQGMITIRQDAGAKVLEGVTSVEEMQRVTV